MEVAGSARERIEKTDQVSLDINNLAKSMREKLKILDPLSDAHCIYRIPPRIRESNEKAYTPRVISIGPFHHGKEELGAMEEHKMSFLEQFLAQSQVSLEVFIRVIKERERKLRNYYAGTIKLSSEEFVKMVLLDAVFILVLLLCECESYRGSRIINYGDVEVDICLLENQIPFFILEDLLEQSSIFANVCTTELAIDFLQRKFGSWVRRDHALKELINSSRQVTHFVDILRICQTPLQDLELSPGQMLKTLNIPSVTQLHRAGVKFLLSSSEKLLDIKFEKGTLELPRLKIDDSKEILFRNVRAYEQCHSQTSYFVSDYFYLISSLVKSPKDVEILVQHGIIEHCMSNNEAVSNLLNNLSNGVSISLNYYYFSVLAEELNGYCNRPWNMWKATLKQDYFNTPWAFISFAAAVIFLILTFIQTDSSVIQVAKM